MRSLALVAMGLGLAAGQGGCGTACAGTTEDCCSDDQGWECCVSQATACVPPRGMFQTSTCCPRWTVGCTTGSVGCCDPAFMWQEFPGPALANVSANRAPSSLPRVTGGEAPVLSRALSGTVGYALFSTQSGLVVLSVEVATGATSKVKVSGPVADYITEFFGGSTRVYPFDPQGKRFVFADQDLASGGTGMHAYTIDAKTGASTSVAITGATGYPAGIAWDQALGALVVGVQTEKTASFYKVSPETGKAEALGQVSRGADESSDTYYAAYITASQQGTVYRVGFKGVTSSASAGLETFSSSSKASAFSSIPLNGAPSSSSLVASGAQGGARWVSLLSGAGGSFAAEAWSAGGNKTTLAQFDNAHAPTTSQGGILGYVGGAVGEGVYAAVACHQTANPITKLMGCKWTAYSVPAAGGAKTENALTPGFLFGDEVAFAGFGI